MESYLETADRIEDFGSRRQRQIISVIMSEVCDYYDINKPANMSYGEFFHYVLLTKQYQPFREMVYELLKTYGVNEKSLLRSLLNISSRFGVSSATRAEMTESFISLPTVYSYDEKILKCLFGTFEIERLYKYANIGKLKLSKKMPFNNHCFEVVQLFANKLGNDNIVVSKLPNLFGGEFLHAYYELKDGTLDLSWGLFFKGDAFQTLAEPTEIIKFPAQELSKRYNELAANDESLPPDLHKVLALALDKVRRGE